MTSCVVKQFQTPSIPEANILGIEASPVYNKTSNLYFFESPANAAPKQIDFCNVTVTYTRPGQDASVHVNIWLPLESADWNGRFQGSGGGGWSGSLGWIGLSPAVAHGYAVAGTDAGHELSFTPNYSVGPWALLGPGKVNYPMLEEFAYLSLNDMTLIGKAITEDYYGKPPHHSYWNGCSNGGRQGLMIAQRYPDLYDGILAAAPAVDFVSTLMNTYWPAQVMKDLGEAPSPAELGALRQKAIKACDRLDGLEDGIIGFPEQCDFNPFDLVGEQFSFQETNGTFTYAGARIAHEVWHGPQLTGPYKGYDGFNMDISMTAQADTKQLPNGSYVPAPLLFGIEFLKYLVAKDPDFSVESMTEDDYLSMLEKGLAEYGPILNADNPSLSAFKETGGKLLTWHGLADQLIVPKATEVYYQRVLEIDPAARDFYRYFKAPGAAHCVPGSGPIPADTLETLARWVEEGETPDTLNAVGVNGSTRPLCAYPLVQTYIGPDPQNPGSFKCVDVGGQSWMDRSGFSRIQQSLRGLRNFWTTGNLEGTDAASKVEL